MLFVLVIQFFFSKALARDTDEKIKLSPKRISPYFLRRIRREKNKFTYAGKEFKKKILKNIGALSENKINFTTKLLEVLKFYSADTQALIHTKKKKI